MPIAKRFGYGLGHLMSYHCQIYVVLPAYCARLIVGRPSNGSFLCSEAQERSEIRLKTSTRFTLLMCDLLQLHHPNETNPTPHHKNR